MRHIEDEKRLAYEENDSRLEHKDDAGAGENALIHVEESIEISALKHEDNAGDKTSSDTPDSSAAPADGQNANPADAQDPNADLTGKGIGLSSKALHILDKILPDDRDNVTSQAIKHDILETPAAVIDALNEVSEMRQRGQRLFFENKDKPDEPIQSDNDRTAIQTDNETDIDPPDEPLLALPEPILALPPGNETIETSEISGNDKALTETEIPILNGKNEKSTPTVEVIEKRDYYEVLGVGRDADEAEIKGAYRTLAKKYHPDVNSGDKAAEAKFKEANEAYSTLIDPEKRQVYDRKTVPKPPDKPGESKTVSKRTVVNKDSAEPQKPTEGKNSKTSANSKGGKKKDRFMRRVLDTGFIFSQGAAHLMPDEQRDEDSGTKGVRSMIAESAKLIKVFATAEKKPAKLNHEDEEMLSHEEPQEENRLEHEKIEGESPLLLEDGTPRLEHEQEETLAIGAGNDAVSENGAENTSLVPVDSEDSSDSMSLFLFPVTAYANENAPVAPPTVEAEIIGSLLRIRAMSGFYAVEAVYVNNRRFNHRVDSALVIDISGYIANGETIAVHAVDFAGNLSNTVLLSPPVPIQPPAPNNITPEGHGELLDHLTSYDRVEFITIETPTGNVFYLIIDHTRSSNNVYFLNPVTEWDLLTLAAETELPMPNHIIQVPPQNEPTVIEREPQETTETPTPEPVPEVPADDGGGRGGTFIFLAIAGAGAFGVIYYLKILKPKKEREMYGGGDEEYEENDGFEDVEDGAEIMDNEDNEDNSDDDIDADGYDVDDGKYYKEGDES